MSGVLPRYLIVVESAYDGAGLRKAESRSEGDGCASDTGPSVEDGKCLPSCNGKRRLVVGACGASLSASPRFDYSDTAK